MQKAALTSLVVFTFGGLAYAGPEAFSGKEMKEVVPVPPACEINWTGFYAGLHVGYGFADAEIHLVGLPPELFGNQTPGAIDPGEEGFLGGIQVGYNRQFGAFVVGVEADLSGTDMDGTNSLSPFFVDGREISESELTAHRDTDWFGTLRGRLGFTPHCRLLLYVTGGLAVGDVHASADSHQDDLIHYAASASDFRLGWTAGAGGEIALNRRWSLKFEYLYYDLDDLTFIANRAPPIGTPYQIRFNADASAYTFNTGLNFHF